MEYPGGRATRGMARRIAMAKRKKGLQRALKKLLEEAVELARKYLSDPRKLRVLLQAAIDKAKKIKKKDSWRKAYDDLCTLIRLVRAWFTGEYREVPWQTMLLVVGAIIYFVNPLDLIPDPLPGGFVDDAALILWVVHSMRGDIDAFRQWEKQNKKGEEGEHEQGAEAATE
jgi:uncharacterized membrane protein YkvA (DUF1232 family)